MNVVALMPLKRNSNRVPGKNFRELNGRPLFAWVLQTLLSVPAIRLVVINTDARELLEYKGSPVDSERVLIRDRPEELRGDDVSMNRILDDDAAAVSAEIYIQTHTTNPLLTKATIETAIRKFREATSLGYDSLFTVTAHYSRFYETGSYRAINHDPGTLIPTQELDPLLEENSSLYLFTPTSFRADRRRIGRRPFLQVMDALEAIDIDTESDWILAEALISRLEKEENDARG